MRYNVLGAVDFVTKEAVTVTNDTYITAAEVCEILRKVSAKYTGRAIHIVPDNAKYQKCRAVQDSAVELCILLVCIPPYSPNLNLIERLLKFVKGELRTKFYDDFTVFCGRIDQIIASTSANNKDKISKLIGIKVQPFDDLKQINSNTFVNTKPRRKKSQGKTLAA